MRGDVTTVTGALLFIFFKKSTMITAYCGQTPHVGAGRWECRECRSFASEKAVGRRARMAASFVIEGIVDEAERVPLLCFPPIVRTPFASHHGKVSYTWRTYVIRTRVRSSVTSDESYSGTLLYEMIHNTMLILQIDSYYCAMCFIQSATDALGNEEGPVKYTDVRAGPLQRDKGLAFKVRKPNREHDSCVSFWNESCLIALRKNQMSGKVSKNGVL